jgi:hypothetical protein
MELRNRAIGYETNQKAVDQTGAENIADLFRVHLLRGCDLIEPE